MCAPSGWPGAEHEADEGEPVEAGEGGSEAFIVAGEAAEACGPAEAALDDPAARQEHEAALGVGQLDHEQGDAVALRRRRRLLAV